jgi:hypothetical protein
MLSGIFGTSKPKLGRQQDNPTSGNPPSNEPLPSSGDLQNQFNSKLQQMKAIISELNKKRSDQRNFNDTVRNRLAEITKQLSTVIIPAVKELKSQIANLRGKYNDLNEEIQQKKDENARIIANMNDQEIQRLLKQIEQIEQEKQQLLDSQATGELDRQQVAEQLQQKEQQLRSAEQQIQEKNNALEEKTQQQVVQIEQNNVEINNLKQNKAQLEQIIKDSMSIMDEIISELNGLNVADNNDVLNNSIESVKQNIDELTQILSGNAQPNTEQPGPNVAPSGSLFPQRSSSPIQQVPKQNNDMPVRYPVWIKGENGAPNYLSIDEAQLTYNTLLRLLSNCPNQRCQEALLEINSLVNPNEQNVIRILFNNNISINNLNGLTITIGNPNVMDDIEEFLTTRNIVSELTGGKKKRRTTKKNNKKTKRNNKKSKKQRGGWHYENKRYRRTSNSKSSRTTRRRGPR